MSGAAEVRRTLKFVQRAFEANVDRLPTRAQYWTRNAASLVEPLASRAWNSREVSPLVSIVVPVYNVERYLPACLGSILSQSHFRLQVVAVDDGSPDRSIDILQAYAARDRRLQIVRQANAGLGAARNVGAQHARGRYLMFVDSDDLLRPDAVAAYVRSLRISGSDFVVGAYQRLKGDVTAPAAPWVRTVRRQIRRGTTVAEFPDIQVNAVAWSKMYCRKFWRDHGLRFPTGVLYEDQVVSARAYALARRFDVLSRVTYLWRIRDDRSSISQQDCEVADLSARFEAAFSSLAELEAAGASEARDVRLSQLLSNDFPLSIKAGQHAGEEFWDVLKAGLNLLTASANEQVWSRVPPQHRLAIRLACAGDQEALLEFIGLQRDNPKSAPSLVVDGQVFVQLPARLPLGLEPNSPVLALTPSQTSMVTGVRRLFARKDGHFEIHGWAYLDNVDLSGTRPRITLLFTNLERPDEPPVELPAIRTLDHEVTARSRHQYADYQNATFRATLDPAVLIRSGASGRWSVQVRVEAHGLDKTAPLKGLQQTGSPGHLPGRLVSGGHLSFSFSAEEGLVVTLVQPLATLERAELCGRSLTVALRAARRFQPQELVLNNDVTGQQLRVPLVRSAKLIFGRVELASSTALNLRHRPAREPWTVRVVGKDGRRGPVAIIRDDWSRGMTGLRLRMTQFGNLGLVDDRSTLIVDALRAEAGERLVEDGGSA